MKMIRLLKERVDSAGVNLGIVAEIVVHVFDINAGGGCSCNAAEGRSAFSMLVGVAVVGTVGHTIQIVTQSA